MALDGELTGEVGKEPAMDSGELFHGRLEVNILWCYGV